MFHICYRMLSDMEVLFWNFFANDNACNALLLLQQPNLNGLTPCTVCGSLLLPKIYMYFLPLHIQNCHQ